MSSTSSASSYKLNCIIDNANGSATQMQAQAQAMINAGVGVLLITDLDPGSGKAIQNLAAAAQRRHRSTTTG